MPIKSVTKTSFENAPIEEIEWNKFDFGFEPSIEQKKIIEFIFRYPDKNVSVNNVAGSGKTTMFVMMETIFKYYKPDMNRLYLTYSKELAKANASAIGDNVRTVHSYAYGIMKRFLDLNKLKTLWSNPKQSNRKSFVNPDMTEELVIERVKEVYPGWEHNKDIQKSMWRSKFAIETIVKDIRQCLLPLNTDAVISFYNTKEKTFVKQDIDDALMLVHKCLNLFITHGVTDFDNLLYMVHIFKNGSTLRPNGFGANLKYKYVDACIPKVHFLGIDEANDSFGTLRNFYKIITDEDTQIVAVGDPQQTIHVWAGAEIDCFYLLKEQLNAEEFIFGTSFRVPVSMQVYLNTSGLDNRIKTPSWSDEGILNQNVSYNTMLFDAAPGDFILCRYNVGNRVTKTLSKVAIDLLEIGKKITLLGNEYVSTMSYLVWKCGINKNSNLDKSTIEKLNKETLSMIEIESNSERPRKAVIEKLLDALEITSRFMVFYLKKFQRNSVTDFLTYCTNMLENDDKESIVLSSIHRAKGKETVRTWFLHSDAVYDTIQTGSSYDERQESKNLFLVALTRHTQEINIVEGNLPDEF